ncbi:trehalase family glycosidase [Paracoccus sp. Z330]|uniref:Trehalase family glycosidase n=1 Tax=Paracoccus onchidii TaxID=3017813 RepID=A0ABT4ZGE1_9RHOB|nr:trehalase family glycosidase [Paracoccus onchidii]MDB6178339.1 trehalase family glycosidase [Paracoccus onchidii]
MPENADQLIARAIEIVTENDRGSYTVPTKGLYPYQWNWDSCLTALGQAHFDEARAWAEIETLMAHQWPCGMVPHIIFHEESDSYFPGPDVWRTGRPVPTTGITQPAVAGFAMARLFARAKDRALATRSVRKLLPRISAWHDWFYRTRDPEATGLVAIIHPWESGRDNSIDWDAALARVPTDGLEPFTRQDILHANPDHRPTQAQYDRYIWLVQHFRSLGWDTERLHDASPFRVVDPGFNAILIRACDELANVAEELGEAELAVRNRTYAQRGRAALNSLWNADLGQYLCFDRAISEQVNSPSVGGILTVFAGLPKTRVAHLATRVEELASRCGYLVPSHDPAAAAFEALRYWRGPAWLVVNYLIADGFRLAEHAEMAERIDADSLRLIAESGFAEYYDPITAEPCGGGRFTWTAAMVLEILNGQKADA